MNLLLIFMKQDKFGIKKKIEIYLSEFQISTGNINYTKIFLKNVTFI